MTWGAMRKRLQRCGLAAWVTECEGGEVTQLRGRAATSPPMTTAAADAAVAAVDTARAAAAARPARAGQEVPWVGGVKGGCICIYVLLYVLDLQTGRENGGSVVGGVQPHLDLAPHAI